jgi:hypothetical protein
VARHRIVKSDKRGALIAQNPISANYSIPTEVKNIVPIVCSSRVEFIWDTAATYFLREEIPRVCAAGELIKYLNEFDPEQLNNKPYVIPVKQKQSSVV